RRASKRVPTGWRRRWQPTSTGSASTPSSARARGAGRWRAGPDHAEAERWIASRPPGAPEPTEAARALIAESRRAATQRQRAWASGSLIAAIVAAGLAGFAMWQRSIAVANEQVAKSAQKDAEVQRNAAVEQRDKALATDSLR